MTTAAALIGLGTGHLIGWRGEDGGVWDKLKEAVGKSDACTPGTAFKAAYEVRDDVVWFVDLRDCDEAALQALDLGVTSFENGRTRAVWISGEMTRFVPPWIRPIAPNGWAGKERIRASDGRVTEYAFEPHPDFPAGFRWHSFAGLDLLVPADLEECGPGCLQRDDLRLSLTWNDGAVPQTKRGAIAEGLLGTANTCESVCEVQLPSGSRRALLWTDHGYLDVGIEGDLSATFHAAGALFSFRPSNK
ncbi:MAG: hypothetical protein R3F61_06485 [Myxococcota bacterium]